MQKWRNLTFLAVAELLAMTLWFSGSAVVPQLKAEWHLSEAQQSWMTMSVQIGFVFGALLSATFNLADRLSARHLFRRPPRTKQAVLGFLSGMCLIDMFLLCLLGRPEAAAVAFGGFVATVLAHRRIWGT